MNEKSENYCCPYCHKEMILKDGKLRCPGCNRNYPIRSGIPVFSEAGDAEDLQEMAHLVSILESRESAAVQDRSALFRLPNRPFSLGRQYTETKAFKGFFSRFSQLSGMRILDISCGVGREAHLLIKHGARNVHLLDISYPAVAYAKKRFSALYPEVKFQYCVSDACLLPFPDHFFDVVLVYASAHHYPDLGKFIQESSRVAEHICLISEPAEIRPFRGLMRLLKWNTEYGRLDTRRFNVSNVKACFKEAGMSYEVERMFQYFPKAFDRLGNSKIFVALWFSFLKLLDIFFGRVIGHSLNIYASGKGSTRASS